LTYNAGVCKVYENDQLLHTFEVDKDFSALQGGMNVGGVNIPGVGIVNGFQGKLKNLLIEEGAHDPPPVDGGGSPVILPPTITLNGQSEVTLRPGEGYIEQGAAASDTYLGALNVVVSGSVGTELGIYTLTYTATDGYGMTATATRTVNVTPWHQPLPGYLVKDISVGADGTVWMVGMDGAVTTLGAAGFRTEPGLDSVVSITVGPTGNAWAVRDNGGIFQWLPASGWAPIYGALARDAGIGADNTRWIVGNTGRIVRWSDSAGWQDLHADLPGEAVSITVGPTGNAWVVFDNGAISQWTASGWGSIYGAAARDAGIGADNTRWIVDNTGRVVRWSDSAGWQDLHIDLPGEARRIAVDANGNAWVAMEDGTIFRYEE